MTKDGNEFFNFDTDLGDNFRAIDKLALSHRNITNCLLEIPQDIKLEIVDGVLILKAGSKLYFANGFEDDEITMKFDKVVIESDVEYNLVGNDADLRIVCYNKTRNSLILYKNHESGTAGYTGTANCFYYKADTNKVVRYTAGVLYDDEISLPIALVQGDGTLVARSIQQVFNGYGFIGSAIFELPGVKGLTVNGINSDGTLATGMKTTTKVTVNFALNRHSNTVISGLDGQLEDTVWLGESDNHPSTEGILASSRYLNTRTNLMMLDAKLDGNWQVQWSFINVFENIEVDPTGVVVSITPKKPFRAVDHNDYQNKIKELEAKIETLQAAVEALQGS